MGIIDRARSIFQSPADRRLAAASAEAFRSAPQPSRTLITSPGAFGPFDPSPTQQGAGQPPRINWWNDQTPPGPSRYSYTPDYSGHTYQQHSATRAFQGWDLCAIRAAVEQHRLGTFWQSYALMIAILGFAPVLAALKQAVDPIIDLAQKAHIVGGDKGLAKLVADEIAEQLVPSGGLLPSRYFPPQLWGAMSIYLRMLGFCVLQHVDGDPDPDTGVRPRFTRIWEPWAVQMYWSPYKWVALTDEAVVEIKNDGKFTLIIDENFGHCSGAIVAIGEEAFAGKFTQEARLNWLQFFGSPKLYATLPEKVSTHGQAGDAFYAALEIIYGPDGRGAFPFGTKLDAVSITGEGAQAFQGALVDIIIHIFMVLTGSAGTIGNGMSSGAGPYQPAKGGSYTVRHDLIARPLIAEVRAVNHGHVAPFCDINYGDAIERSKRAGAWAYPVLTVDIDDPDRDQRTESLARREEARTAIIKSRRDVGVLVDQAEADHIATSLELRKVPLAADTPKGGEIFQYHITEKQVAVDEVRARLGLAPLPGGIGSIEQLAREREDGRDKTGAVKVREDATEPSDDAPDEEAT